MNRNLTVNLPEELIHQIRIHAAHRNQSMTSLVKDAVHRMLHEGDDVKSAHSRLVDRMRNSPDRGLPDRIPWTREELHER